MLAKCSRCSQTFQTDRYGEQFCPFCGAAVMIAAPAGEAQGALPPGALPPPGAAGPQDQEAPVDNPAAHGGWLSAAVATWKKSVFDPSAFFGRLKPGPGTGGAIGYGMAVLALGGVFGALNQYLQGMLQRGQLEQVQQQLGQMPEGFRHFMELALRFSQPTVAMLILLPLAAMAGFFLNVALVHVALMVVGGAKSGFAATLRAMAFAQGPQLFYVVPVCGSLVGGIWALVLSVIGLAGVHRVGVGRVIGAYAVLVFACCCLCGVPLVALASYGLQQAAHATGGAFDVP